MTTPTTVQVRFQFRADTAANWTSIDPILLANELGRETDTGKIKIGDGTTAWSSLAYQALGRISDSDIAADAEIAVSKLANGTANQILTTDGTDVSWTDSPTIAGNVIISGNLTVNGTETIINVDTLQVEDKTIEMGNVTTPTDLTADGGGVVLKGSSDKTILWVDATDSWTSSENVDLASGKTYKIAGTDVLSATTLGSGVVNSSLTSVGNLTDLTVDTDTLYVDATNDRVGVNTATPANTLDVTSANSTISSTSTGNSTGKIALNADRAASTVNGQILGQWNGNTVSRIDFINGADDVNKDDGSISFLTSNNSSNPLTRMSIAQNGDVAIDTDTLYVDATNNRVGVGTASPGTKLEVSDSEPYLQISSTASQTGNNLGGIRFSTADPSYLAGGNPAYINAKDFSSNGSAFGLVFGTQNTDQMVIDNSGNVGIGATTPTQLLDLESGTGARIAFTDTGTRRWSIGTPAGGSTSFSIYDESGSSEALRIVTSGNVGIGQVSPAQLLDVNGDALINGLTIGMGAGSLNGNTAIGESVLANAISGSQNNTGVGFNALNDITDGMNNTAVGSGAGARLTTGGACTFIGVSSGAVTTGGNNVGAGAFSLQNNTVGTNNVSIGVLSLNNSVAGISGTAVGYSSQRYANDATDAWTNTNVSVGFESLRGSTTPADNTGVANVAVGYQALRFNTSGVTNTAIGNVALYVNTTGNQNVSIGGSSLFDNTTGSNNVAIGLSALANNVGGNNGVAIGTQSQINYNDTSDSHSNTNTSVGFQSLFGSATPANNTGLANTAVGYQAMFDNTSGTNNIAVGNSALANNTSGLANVAIGVQPLLNNTTGSSNVGVGTLTLATSTVVDQCTAVGFESQRFSDSTTTNKDANNTSVGWRALRGSTTAADNTGVNNTAIGAATMQLNSSGNNNTAVGGSALAANTTGGTNTAVGLYALIRNTTGSNNSALGYNAGRYDQDNNDTANFTNCTYLGQNTRASGDNQVQLGDSSTTTYAYGSVQDRSDERDKTDIRDTVIGLDFINTLRPVDFRWDMRDDYFDTEIYEEEVTETVEVPNPAYVEDGDEPQYIEETVTKMVTKDRLVPVPKDGSRKRNRFHHGLIAQEVKAAADAAGVDFAGYQDHSVGGGKDVLTLGYSELIAPLIKAVQELSAENAAMKARLDALEGV